MADTYTLLHPDASGDLILLAEHAGREFPTGTGTLGFSEEEFAEDRNLPFDTGVKGITTSLAERLGATAILGRYSRLLIDLNRLPTDAGLIPAKAHGKPVCGNADIAEAERDRRKTLFYDPYHAEIERQIARRRKNGRTPLLFAIHSFTPSVGFKAMKVPMPEGGIDLSFVYLDKHGNALMEALHGGMSRYPDIRCIDNTPYDLTKLRTGSIVRHGEPLGLPIAGVEISIERLNGEADEAFWAGLLAQALETLPEANG